MCKEFLFFDITSHDITHQPKVALLIRWKDGWPVNIYSHVAKTSLPVGRMHGPYDTKAYGKTEYLPAGDVDDPSNAFTCGKGISPR